MQDDLGLIDMAQRQGTAGQPVLVGQRNVLQQDFGCREVRASSYRALLHVLQHSVDSKKEGFSASMSLEGKRTGQHGLTFSKVPQSLLPSLECPPDCAEERKEHLQGKHEMALR